MTYCRGYSGGRADVRKRGQVPTRCGPPHSSPAFRPLHLSAAAPPLPGQPRPRLSPSTQGAPVHGSPSRLRR